MRQRVELEAGDCGEEGGGAAMRIRREGSEGRDQKGGLSRQ